ncbi:MAG: helix-turn-helix domain-containing protein [Acidobacteriota bacterium]
MNETKATMSEKEFCQQVGLSRVSIWRLRKAGKLAYIRVGGKVLYTPRHVEEFLAAHERPVCEVKRRNVGV